MAEEIRHTRTQLSKQPSFNLRSIGQRWIYRFKSRYPDLKSIWSRQLPSARFKAMDRQAIQSYFDVVMQQYQEHQYPPDRIYNMDESGFAVGDSQTSRVLVNSRVASNFKQING